MAQIEKSCRIWFYSRDVDATASLSTSTSSQSSSTGAPKALKHWAIILDYMSTRNPSQVNKRILYEALNTAGLLVARWLEHAGDEEEDWKNKSGFMREDHGMVTINEERAKNYCDNFNQQKIKYVAISDNCQRFVDEFIANLLPDAAISLPTSIKEVKTGVFSALSTSLNSLSNVGSATLIQDLIIKSIGNANGYDLMFKEAIQQINLNGFGKISILKQSPFKEFMEKEGKTLILSCLGEMTENMMNASRGAFSWLNLLQVPVELIVGKLMSSTGFTDLQAYGGKKLASCVTAAGVGALAGGPFGCLGSVAFWIASEVVTTLFKCLLNKLVGKSFTEKFGESDTLKLIGSIYSYFEMKMKSGLVASLKWMSDYMESTQSRLKKLALNRPQTLSSLNKGNNKCIALLFHPKGFHFYSTF